MSTVDVFVPCYRYGHYLAECVHSVLEQEGVEVRVLILDDASPDNTPDVAQALLREDRRVEYRRHEANRGHVATYNEGLAWVAADYLLLLSADDLLTPGALRRAADVLDAHPDVAMCFGREIVYRTPQDREQVPACVESYGCQILTGREYLENVCRTAVNPVQTVTAVVRTATQREVGGYSWQLPHAGDMEMWMRLAAHGSIAKLDCYQGLYRKHQNNMSIAYYRSPWKDMEQRRTTFDRFFQRYRDQLPDAERLEASARLHLAEDAFGMATGLFYQRDCRGARACLAFMQETHPRARSWPGVSRVWWRSLLGRRFWLLFDSIATVVRRHA